VSSRFSLPVTPTAPAQPGIADPGGPGGPGGGAVAGGPSALSGAPIAAGAPLNAPVVLVVQPAAADDDGAVSPQGAADYFVSGAPGARVTLSLRRVANSGGHAHGGETSDPAAVGSISPQSLTLSGPFPQNVKVTHRVADVCGAITVRAQFSKGDPPVREARTEVRFGGLVALPQRASLRYKTPTTAHPAPYFGTPALADALARLAEAYFARTGRPLTVTDANLATGGRFDLDLNWLPPHKTHQTGRNADLRKRDMTAAEQGVLREEAARLGINVLDEGDHFHIRV
jgi:hypothetical protein